MIVLFLAHEPLILWRLLRCIETIKRLRTLINLIFSHQILIIMKRIRLNLLVPFCIAMIILFAFVAPPYSLIGQWSLLLPNGTESGEYIFFNADSTYAIKLPNGEVGERGLYFLKDSIFSIKNIKDHACGKNYWGKYNLTFYGNDSVHFTLIEDSCTARRTDIVGYNPGIKRYKTK
jgi:hypothetical protein